MRTPPFWPDKPTIWFLQMEGYFSLSGITQDTTKFYYVITQLESKYAQEVEDIIINPSKEKKYQPIKDKLIRRLSTSPEHEIKQLFEHEEIGGLHCSF